MREINGITGMMSDNDGEFQYANLNIVELNDFIRKDTKEYKDFANSLCGKIYLIENTTLTETKSVIDVVENQIKFEETNYEKRVAELEGSELTEGGFFAKMSFNKKKANDLKALEKEHKKTLEVLEDRLKKHRRELENANAMYLRLIDKLKDKGIFWQEIRKLVEEKLRLGILSYSKNLGKKPSVAKINPDEFDQFMDKGPKKKQNRTRSSGSNIDFYGDPNNFDESKLSPMEQIEFRKMLKRFNHNRDMFEEWEEAKRLRMGLFSLEKSRELDMLRSQTSDYALHRTFGRIFGQNRDNDLWCGLCNAWGLDPRTVHGHDHENQSIFGMFGMGPWGPYGPPPGAGHPGHHPGYPGHHPRHRHPGFGHFGRDFGDRLEGIYDRNRDNLSRDNFFRASELGSNTKPDSNGRNYIREVARSCARNSLKDSGCGLSELTEKLPDMTRAYESIFKNPTTMGLLESFYDNKITSSEFEGEYGHALLNSVKEKAKEAELEAEREMEMHMALQMDGPDFNGQGGAKH